MSRDMGRLRALVRTQRDDILSLQSEVGHYQTRVQRIEEGHRLELARCKKEVEYHKRLRQGADQRAYELQQQLAQARISPAEASSEEHSTLIEQSQILISKNSELQYKLKTMEGQVQQLEELKAALENELQQVYWERDALGAELEQVLAHSHCHTGGGAEDEADFSAEPDVEPAATPPSQASPE